MLESDEAGISQQSAEERISQYGLNEVQYDKPPSWFVQLIRSFLNPFIFILLAIVIISYGIDVFFAAPGEKDFKTVIVVAVMILSSGFLSFFQEYRSSRPAEQLKSMIKTTAAVIREGKGRQEIPIEEIVPGEIIRLSAGDMIASGLRVISSADYLLH